jgi:hypothetical protein
MLTSQNPMLQNVASAIYPTLQPEKAKLQLGNINPADFTPASIATAMKSGNVGDLVSIAKGGAAPTELARLIAERALLKEGDPNISRFDAAINNETRGKGTTVHLPSSRDLQRDESGLRDQLQSRLKSMDWDGVKSAYQRIYTAPNTPVGDVAIVYAVAKADDSTGAVRKEDFDLRAKDGSLGGRIKSLYEEAKTGKMLPERRQQLIDTAYELYIARQNEVNAVIDEYGNIANRSGLNVQNVTNPFKSKVLERRIVWSADKQAKLDALSKKGEN